MGAQSIVGRISEVLLYIYLPLFTTRSSIVSAIVFTASVGFGDLTFGFLTASSQTSGTVSRYAFAPLFLSTRLTDVGYSIKYPPRLNAIAFPVRRCVKGRGSDVCESRTGWGGRTCIIRTSEKQREPIFSSDV